MTIFEITSVIGLIIGPIAGALIAFGLQDRSLKRLRQLDVFRTLMRTRRTPLSADHVGALNLIEIDFANHASVLQAHKQLFQNFSTAAPRLASEEVGPKDDESARQQKESAYARRIFEDRQHLLAKLLFSMGRALGYRLEQLEILEGGYHPTLYANIEAQQESIRQFVAAISRGEKAVPVRILERDE